MFRGFFYATLAACTFGLIPLFTMPIVETGFPSTSTLFLRFGFASMIIAILALARGQSLRISLKDFIKFLGMGFFYALSAVTFFWAFEYMDTGIVATVQYCYPIFVVLLMVFFFKERLRLSTLAAAIIICVGVALFSIQDPSKVEVNFMGMFLTIFSATQMALYVMGIQVFNLEVKNQMLVGLYILVSSAIFSGIFALLEGGIVLPTLAVQWKNLALLTIITGVISTMALVRSVKYIGPSLTAILGGIEPVTAMLVGVFVFNEVCTFLNILGALCIVGAVTLVAVVSHLRPTV